MAEEEVTATEEAAPVEEQEESTTSEETEETADDSSAEPEKKSKGVQKRIDELVRQREEERRRSERLEQMLHESYTKKPETVQPEVVEKPPKEDSFDDYNEYLKAMARFEARQELRQEQDRTRKEQERQQAEQSQRTQQEKISEVLAKGSAEKEDFDLVVRNPSLALTNEMVGIAAESTVGHDVLYFLGKNPEESARISQLPPLSQAREIGKIEARITTKQPKTPTNAPDPIKPVSTVGNLAEKDPAKMSDKEFAKWRQQRVKSRGRR